MVVVGGGAGLDQIREGFHEEVRPGGILNRERLGQRSRGWRELLGRSVEWQKQWEDVRTFSMTNSKVPKSPVKGSFCAPTG